MKFSHVPVMLNECIESLRIKEDGKYFDGTLGGAGHSKEILKRLKGDGLLVATDRDEEAVKNSEELVKNSGGKFIVFNDNFKNFNAIKNSLGLDGFDGALLDLGVSSYQLDNRSRGFSYLSDDSKLDMRMDRSRPFSAKDVVNGYPEEKLRYMIDTYGEEKFARKIAENICKARAEKPIETTGELVKIVDESIPYKFKQNGHPAKKTFQAIRIEVNEELDGLGQAVKDIIRGLNKGGRIAILTFHSLEDRIVKQTFKDLETDCVCDKRFPVCVCGKKKEIEIVTKKPIEASESEKELNPRSKSAKLRVAEKI